MHCNGTSGGARKATWAKRIGFQSAQIAFHVVCSSHKFPLLIIITLSVVYDSDALVNIYIILNDLIFDNHYLYTKCNQSYIHKTP